MISGSGALAALLGWSYTIPYRVMHHRVYGQLPRREQPRQNSQLRSEIMDIHEPGAVHTVLRVCLLEAYGMWGWQEAP